MVFKIFFFQLTVIDSEMIEKGPGGFWYNFKIFHSTEPAKGNKALSRIVCDKWFCS